MIHETIDPQTNTRVLINLDQVAHVTMRPDQDHISVQFSSGTLRLKCASCEAAQSEYASIKQRMQESATLKDCRTQTPSRTHLSENNQLEAVRNIDNKQDDA